MKLTDKHIEELYKFTRKHYVEYYDLQTELVDHMANDIEEIWVAQPQLSFEQARDISFKKFGIFGFMEVVEERQKTMSKKYMKLMLSFALEYFKFPKIMQTAFFIVVLYSVLHFVQNKVYVIAPFIVLGITWMIFQIAKATKKLKKNEQLSGKKWMFEEMIFKIGAGVSGVGALTFQIPNFIINTELNFENWSTLMEIGFSVFLIAVSVMYYVVMKTIPAKAEELLKSQYPEYQMMKKGG